MHPPQAYGKIISCVFSAVPRVSLLLELVWMPKEGSRNSEVLQIYGDLLASTLKQELIINTASCERCLLSLQ